MTRSLYNETRAAGQAAEVWAAGGEPSDELIATAEAGIGAMGVLLLEQLVQQGLNPSSERAAMIAEVRVRVHEVIAGSLERLAAAAIDAHASDGSGGLRHAVAPATVTVATENRAEAEEDGQPMRYMGVWRGDRSYRSGAAVTDAGTLWVARDDVAEGARPGKSKSWQLAVKAGREARPR